MRTEHLAERHLGLDGERVAATLLALDLAPAPGEVADHVAEELLRGHDLDRHHGLEQDRLRAARGILDRHRPRDLERHLGGVDVVVGAVDELDANVDHRIPGLHPRLEGLLDARLDGGE